MRCSKLITNVVNSDSVAYICDQTRDGAPTLDLQMVDGDRMNKHCVLYYVAVDVSVIGKLQAQRHTRRQGK